MLHESRRHADYLGYLAVGPFGSSARWFGYYNAGDGRIRLFYVFFILHISEGSSAYYNIQGPCPIKAALSSISTLNYLNSLMFGKGSYQYSKYFYLLTLNYGLKIM